MGTQLGLLSSCGLARILTADPLCSLKSDLSAPDGAIPLSFCQSSPEDVLIGLREKGSGGESERQRQRTRNVGVAFPTRPPGTALQPLSRTAGPFAFFGLTFRWSLFSQPFTPDLPVSSV